MVQALIGSVLGTLGGQSRSSTALTVRREDTSTLAVASAPTDKRAKQARKNAQEERLMAVLTDPAVIGIIALLAGIFIAEKIPWSEDESRRKALRALALSGVMLTALGRAGVGDLTTLGIAGLAGASSFVGDDGGVSLVGSLGESLGVSLGGSVVDVGGNFSEALNALIYAVKHPLDLSGAGYRSQK